MIDYNRLQTAIYTWIDGLYLFPQIIWYYPNAPKPNEPYISLNITGFRRIGHDYQMPTSVEGFSYVVGQRRLSLEIQVYSNDRREIYEVMDAVQGSLYVPDVTNHLLASGLAYVTSNSVNQTTTLLDTTFEQRAILEVAFRYATNTPLGDISPFDAGFIEDVEVNSNIEE